MVFCLQNCSDLLWKKNVLECDRQYANNLRNLEQFIWTVKGHYNFETKCSLKLFLEVSQIYFVRTVIIQIGKNNWDLKSTGKVKKKSVYVVYC